MAGRQQGLAEHHPGLGHVGVRRVTQPGLPVRQQLDRQPNGLGHPAAGPRDVGLGAGGHGQPPPGGRVVRVTFGQAEPGLEHPGDQVGRAGAVRDLGGQPGQVGVGPRDPRHVMAEVLLGHPAGQLPRVRGGHPVAVPERGQPQVARGIAEPLQVVPLGARVRRPGRHQFLPERDGPACLPDAPLVQRARLQQDPDHDRVGVRLGSRVGSPPDHGRQRDLAALQVPRQRPGQPGQVALEPQRRQAARDEIDRTLPVGQTGPEGDVGQPGGAVGGVGVGQVGDRLRAVPQHRAEKIGEDVIPAAPGRGRDPAPPADRPARRRGVTAGGQLPLLGGGDVADAVADLGHQRLLGPVKCDDHGQRRGRGRPGGRHRRDGLGTRPVRPAGEVPPGVRGGQGDEYPAVAHLVVQPYRGPALLAGQPDRGGHVSGADRVVGGAAQHVGGRRGDGREPLILRRQRSAPLHPADLPQDHHDRPNPENGSAIFT